MLGWFRLYGMAAAASKVETTALKAICQKKSDCFKKEAAAAAVTAKKEAAAEAARLKKEAAAAKFWETGESIKSTTTSTTEYVKSSSSNAASSVNSSFWNVVTMAQKVIRSFDLSVFGIFGISIHSIFVNEKV